MEQQYQASHELARNAQMFARVTDEDVTRVITETRERLHEMPQKISRFIEVVTRYREKFADRAETVVALQNI